LTPCNWHNLRAYFLNLVKQNRRLVPQGLVGPFRVVVANPGTDDTLGLEQGFEAVLPDALFLQALDEPLHDAVLLRRAGSDELLGQPVASDGVRVALAGKNQTVVASQDDRLLGSPEVPEAVNQ